MAINIKNEETCRMARELAMLTGDSMTGAITAALRDRLERAVRRRGTGDLARDLRAIGTRCAGLLQAGPTAVGCDEVLYDEHGLPR